MLYIFAYICFIYVSWYSEFMSVFAFLGWHIVDIVSFKSKQGRELGRCPTRENPFLLDDWPVWKGGILTSILIARELC